MGIAVFFDMDGTLVDSSGDLCATVNHTRRELGLAELPRAEILSHVGLGARRLLVDSIPEMANDEQRLVETFMAHYGEHMMETVALYPGVEATLAELARRGVALGVNTAKPGFATRAILDRLGVRRYFGDAIVAGGDCPEMKPSAMPLLKCAEIMGHSVSPDDWMVGDSWTDIDCAAAAGVNSVWCAFGFGRLRDGGKPYTRRADYFNEILKWIKQ